MAIKKMNADMLEKIAKGEEIKEESTSLTEEQAETLFNAGMTELLKLTMVTNAMLSTMASSCFGEALLGTPEFDEFKSSAEHYINTVIPSLLKGDIDSIINEAAPSETEEDAIAFREGLEKLRIEFYEKLMQRYL